MPATPPHPHLLPRPALIPNPTFGGLKTLPGFPRCKYPPPISFLGPPRYSDSPGNLPFAFSATLSAVSEAAGGLSLETPFECPFANLASIAPTVDLEEFRSCCFAHAPSALPVTDSSPSDFTSLAARSRLNISDVVGTVRPSLLCVRRRAAPPVVERDRLAASAGLGAKTWL